jgi:hypothetical protein
MGTTTRFGFRYPEPTDETDPPTDLRELAEDADGYTSRLFECTSTTRPTDVPNGFMISETDTGGTYKRLAGAWVALGGGGGGGGGGSTASYRAANTSAQNIPAVEGNTAISFPTETDTDPLVERGTSGSGHKFKLLASGLWSAKASVRIASASPPGEVSIDLRVVADNRSLDLDGRGQGGVPRSLHVSALEYFPANTELHVLGYNGSGSQRVTEPNGGNWVHVSLALVG